MIQKLNPYRLTGLHKPLGKGFIFHARSDIPRRMIVHADNRHREMLQGALEDFADDGAGVVDGAFFQILDGNDAVLGIEECDFEDFFLEVTHLRHQNIDDVLGGFDPRTLEAGFVFSKTPADFQRGFDLGDFGGSDAFKLQPITRVSVAHVPEGLEFVDDFSGQVQGTLTLGTGAKQNGE